MISKKIQRIVPKNTLLFLCDMQELFRDRIYQMPSCIQTAQMMNQIASIFNLPMIVTEHNSKTFGKTMKEIQETLPSSHKIFEKTCFSMIINDAVNKYVEEQQNINSIILYGIEAHVCVQQTTLDLLQKGYDVYILTDGISSQRDFDRKTALLRMEKAGAILTTAESAIFEILGDSKHPDFKKVLNILKWDRSLQMKDLF